MRIAEKTLWVIISCAIITCAAAVGAPGQNNSNVSSFTREDFDNSICFQKCHNPKRISPEDKPKNLWRLLIEEGGHDIFAEIPWESPEQKEQILQYLLNQAKKDEPESEGIGFWSSPR